MLYRKLAITRDPDGDGVEVRDPRVPDRTLYRAPTAAHAQGWIDAYRRGARWAVAAELPASVSS